MIVDLRSDTVTLPSGAMREAMAVAEVGDDVLGEDPTVNRLEEDAARLLGKPAALFVTSGTMANLLAVLVHARSGEELIADVDSHLFLYEVAGAAALAGVQIHPVRARRGVVDPEELVRAIRPRDDIHQPRTVAVSIENTHNRHGGAVWPLDALGQLCNTARTHGIAVHMDGARLFNAAVALRVAPAAIAAHTDTVAFCVSKGLGAPVGSLLVGDLDEILQARKWRKALGGGWRQAGILAAAGRWALEHMPERLSEDHRRARELANGLSELPGIDLAVTKVETNIVLFTVSGVSASVFLAGCRERGVLGGSYGGYGIRFVTHCDIDDWAIDRALTVCAEVISSL